jgi:hypothetical protein
MAGEVASWRAFEESAPDIGAAGRRLLRADGSGVAYLATVRKDGGPRVHPVMPVLAGGSLYVFVVNLGWKYHDLKRDGRYALHCSPPAEGSEEFYVTGPAVESSDVEERRRVQEASGGRLGHHDFEALFELGIDRALHTKWANWGTAETWPEYFKWAAPG